MEKKKPVYKWIAVDSKVGNDLKVFAAKQGKTIREVAEEAIVQRIEENEKEKTD